MHKVIGGKEYVKCELCPKFATLHNAGLLGWDWFTGRLPETVHYCHVHARSPERNMAYDKAMEMKPVRVR